MKQFLAVFVGTPEAMEKSGWNALDEKSRKEREAAGFQAWVEALGEVEATRVPTSLREVVEAEKDQPKRTTADVGAVDGLVEAWGDTEPEPFLFGAPKKVQQVPAARRREAAPKAPRRSSGASSTSSSAPKRAPAPSGSARMTASTRRRAASAGSSASKMHSSLSSGAMSETLRPAYSRLTA